MRRLFDYVREHTIYSRGLNRESVVVDLGANHREFSLKMRQAYGCTCFLFEANPELLSQIELPDRCHKAHCAVTSEDGPVVFHITENDEASSLMRLPSHSSVGAKVMRSIEVPGKTSRLS